jgi:hypothetical protein
LFIRPRWWCFGTVTISSYCICRARSVSPLFDEAGKGGTTAKTYDNGCVDWFTSANDNLTGSRRCIRLMQVM